jgi:hypothetical protein
MKLLGLIFFGTMAHSERKGELTSLSVSAFVKSSVEMAITETSSGYLAEARCMHAPGCDGVPVYAFSNKPIVFAFDGQSINDNNLYLAQE